MYTKTQGLLFMILDTGTLFFFRFNFKNTFIKIKANTAQTTVCELEDNRYGGWALKTEHNYGQSRIFLDMNARA